MIQDVHEDSEMTLEVATSITKSTKCYDIDKLAKEDAPPELPEITLTSALEELPGAMTNSIDNDLCNATTPNEITLPDNELLALEHNEILDDFESLMNLENNWDNSDLMPIGGAPVFDVIKEMNTEFSVYQDLEIAMDNAHLLDENLLANGATPSSRKTKSVSNDNVPVSPKGRFRTKTHGIKKLTPEEKKDKKFKCEDCEFTAYSRKGVSNHYTEKHGSCECEYCEHFFSNPHALKRHMYDHSSDKRY